MLHSPVASAVSVVECFSLEVRKVVSVCRSTECVFGSCCGSCACAYCVLRQVLCVQEASVWSSGMILPLGGRGPEFKSRYGPTSCFARVLADFMPVVILIESHSLLFQRFFSFPFAKQYVTKVALQKSKIPETIQIAKLLLGLFNIWFTLWHTSKDHWFQNCFHPVVDLMNRKKVISIFLGGGVELMFLCADVWIEISCPLSWSSSNCITTWISKIKLE